MGISRAGMCSSVIWVRQKLGRVGFLIVGLFVQGELMEKQNTWELSLGSRANDLEQAGHA